jgi:hypothetical protein
MACSWVDLASRSRTLSLSENISSGTKQSLDQRGEAEEDEEEEDEEEEEEEEEEEAEERTELESGAFKDWNALFTTAS